MQVVRLRRCSQLVVQYIVDIVVADEMVRDALDGNTHRLLHQAICLEAV